jgi:dihydrodipicolinate synthase/N-acetylneuraminate lyase
VDIPNIIYNIPLFTQPLSYDLVERLSVHENIVGMKDSSGSMVDFLHFSDVSQSGPKPFHMMTGREEMFYPCLAMGAKGCMTATSGILPEIMANILRAWEKGDHEAARNLQASILPIVRTLFKPAFPLGFKAALELRGFDMGGPKLPLSGEEEAAFQVLRLRIKAAMNPVLEKHGLA